MDKMAATRGNLKFPRPNTINKGHLEFNSDILINICSFIYYVKLLAAINQRYRSQAIKFVEARSTYICYLHYNCAPYVSLFLYISRHQQKTNTYCERLIFFSCKETESLFLHMDQITGCVWQDIGLKSRRRKQIDRRNSFIAIPCKRLDLYITRQGKTLYEPRLTVAGPNWWHKHRSLQIHYPLDA